MRKTILLLLTLLLLTATGLATSNRLTPAEERPITVLRQDGTVSHYDTLEPEMFAALSAEPQDITICLNQDLSLSCSSGINFLSFAELLKDTAELTLDLGGHTLRFSGTSNLFTIPCDGSFTVKNGTILYDNNGTGRSVFVLSGAALSQSHPQDASVVLTPRLHLQQLTVCSTNPETGRILNSFAWMAEITADRCFFWTLADSSPAMELRLSSQKDSTGAQWEGEASILLQLTGSTLGTAGNYTISGVSACQVTGENSALVSRTAPTDPLNAVTIDLPGAVRTELFRKILPQGTEVSGLAAIYAEPGMYVPVGQFPDEMVLPDTGVSISLLCFAAALSLSAALLTRKRRIS